MKPLNLPMTQFWDHSVSLSRLAQVEQYIQLNEKAIILHLQSSDKPSQGLQYLLNLIGGIRHPSMRLAQEQPDCLSFRSIKIDPITAWQLSLLLQCTKLQSLKLNHVEVTGIAYLEKMAREVALKQLRVDYSLLTGAAIGRLAGCQLEVLQLRHAGIGREVLQTISFQRMNKLKELDLHGNLIVNEDVGFIVEKIVQRLKRLEALGLGGNRINSPESLGRLMRSIGNIDLNGDQIKEFERRKAECEQISRFNKLRKRNVPEKAVPVLPEVNILENDILVQTKRFQLLALDRNAIPQTCLPGVLQFLSRNGKIQLFISGNQLSFQSTRGLTNLLM